MAADVKLFCWRGFTGTAAGEGTTEGPDDESEHGEDDDPVSYCFGFFLSFVAFSGVSLRVLVLLVSV